MTPPDWLTQRGNTLKLDPDGSTWYVLLDGEPHYALVAVPAGNRFGCVVRQTINGQRVPSEGTYATSEEAISAGLEALRKALGWG